MSEDEMPKRSYRKQRPDDEPSTLKVLPITRAMPEQPKEGGRPRKKRTPPRPVFDMEPLEQEWFEYFIASYNEEYPDLTNSDQILLMLAAIEYIKYLRVAQKELTDRTVISMARQHPATNMRGLLNDLSVVRRQRPATMTTEQKKAQEFADRLLGLSN